jgi:hypothetical protein
VKFVATKEGMTTNIFSPLSFVAVFGSGIWDKHPDPQHCVHGSCSIIELGGFASLCPYHV